MDINQVAYGITQSVMANYSDHKMPNLGLSAWFPTLTQPGKQVAFKARRSRQLVAVDVLRATSSNRNIFSKFSQKIFLPPFFNEAFDFTSTEIYDATFNMGVAPQGPQAGRMIDEATEYMIEVKAKIMRAIEKMRASVLQYGTCTFVNGDSIDYKRQAASMVVLAGANTWVSANLATAQPLVDLTLGCTFLRQQGLSVGNEVNAVLGDTAMVNLLKFAAINTERQIFSNFRRADIGMSVLNQVTGLTFYGRVGAGDFVVNLWTYSDFYENADGSKSKYIADNNVVLIPPDFDANTVYAGVPMVMGDQFNGGMYIGTQEGEFMVHDIIDPQKKSWDIITESAPLPVLRSVDRVYTIQTA